MIPGGRFDLASMELSAAEMPCCGGSGVRLVDHQGRGAMVRCDLKSRQATAQQVLTAYMTRWGISDPRTSIEKTASREEQARILMRLAAFAEAFKKNILTADASRGLWFVSNQPQLQSGPGAVWWAAVVAAWRFGLKVHVVDLDAARQGPLLPPEVWRKDGRPGGVFVDRVGGMWDMGLAQEMETLIGFCANSGIPLWLSCIGGASDEAKSDRPKLKLSTKSAFSQKIGASKNRSWDSWLRDAMRDRLRETTDLD